MQLDPIVWSVVLGRSVRRMKWSSTCHLRAAERGWNASHTLAYLGRRPGPLIATGLDVRSPCPRTYSTYNTEIAKITETKEGVENSTENSTIDVENIDETMSRAIKIIMAEKVLNYEFQDEDLLWEALQAPGSNVTTLNGRLLLQGNKGLATIGDAVITLVVKLECYRLDRSIGNTATILQRLVNNARFASLCDRTGLAACINRNPSQRDTIVPPRLRADAIEAVVGAVYKDGGIDSAKSVMRSLQILEHEEYCFRVIRRGVWGPVRKGTWDDSTVLSIQGSAMGSPRRAAPSASSNMFHMLRPRCPA